MNRIIHFLSIIVMSSVLLLPSLALASDRDHDGLSKRMERRLGTNPRIADSDGDGINDGQEVYRTNTDPSDADSDDDGVSDSREITCNHSDPEDSDSDDDGIEDGDEDSNGNGEPDSDEDAHDD